MSAEQRVLREGWRQESAPVGAIPGRGGEQGGPQPRLKPIDRQQVCLRAIDVERLVGEEHPVRAIWEMLEQQDLRAFYAGIEAVEGGPGRDAFDPRVLIALWLYALSRGVREARALDEWAQYEPGCQWLLGLGRINYHTLADFVTRHAAALDALFVEVVHVLMAAGAVELERVAHDGTKIRAAASASSFKREERLRACREQAEAQVEALKGQTAGSLSRAQRKAQERAARERGKRVQQAQEELARQQAGKPAKDAAEMRVSVTEPEAGRMRQGDGGFSPSYNAQVSTDAQCGVILAYEASSAKEDSGELRGALERIEQNTGQTPRQILVDGSYTTRENIIATADHPSELIGSLGESRAHAKLRRRGVSPEFFPEKFAYDEAKNTYTCPQGKVLHYATRKQLKGAVEKHYRAPASDCAACPLREHCCPQTKRGRMVVRTEEDPKVKAFRAKMEEPRYRAIYRQRGPVAEFSNACLKEKRGLRKFLRRGRVKARAELAWACLSCNVAIWIRVVWKKRRVEGE
jgi:transposase